MRKKFAGMHVREEKRDRNNHKKAVNGKRKRNYVKFAFQVRETENSGKNNLRM